MGRPSVPSAVDPDASTSVGAGLPPHALSAPAAAERFHVRLGGERLSGPSEPDDWQVANCYMGRIGLINSGGASGTGNIFYAVESENGREIVDAQRPAFGVGDFSCTSGLYDTIFGDAPMSVLDDGLEHRSDDGEQHDAGVGVAVLVTAKECGDDGVLAGLKEGALVIDFDTSIPGSTRAVQPATKRTINKINREFNFKSGYAPINPRHSL